MFVHQGALSNGNAAANGGVPRIEADLVGASAGHVYVDRTQGGAYEATFGGRPHTLSSSTVATMTDGDVGLMTPARRAASSATVNRTGPSPFGAILTRSEGNLLAQRMYSSSGDLLAPEYVQRVPLPHGVQVYDVVQTVDDVSPHSYEHSGWGEPAGYQGEIHVGSLAFPAQPPSYQQARDDVFSSDDYRY